MISLLTSSCQHLVMSHLKNRFLEALHSAAVPAIITHTHTSLGGNFRHEKKKYV